MTSFRLEVGKPALPQLLAYLEQTGFEPENCIDLTTGLRPPFKPLVEELRAHFAGSSNFDFGQLSRLMAYANDWAHLVNRVRFAQLLASVLAEARMHTPAPPIPADPNMCIDNA